MHVTCALPWPCGLCGPHSARRRGQSSHSGLPDASRRSETEGLTTQQHAPHRGASNEHVPAVKQAEAHSSVRSLTRGDRSCRSSGSDRSGREECCCATILAHIHWHTLWLHAARHSRPIGPLLRAHGSESEVSQKRSVRHVFIDENMSIRP